MNRNESSPNRSRLAVVAGVFMGGLAISTLASKCRNAEVEEVRSTVKEVQAAPHRISKTLRKPSPQSLGCSPEPLEGESDEGGLENDPNTLQYAYSYRVAQCVEKKAAEAGQDVMCELKEANVECHEGDLQVPCEGYLEKYIECIGYDDESYPNSYAVVYLGPIYEGGLGGLLDGDPGEKSYASYVTNSAEHPYSYMKSAFDNFNLSDFRESSPLNDNYYFDTLYGGRDISSLADELDPLCDSTLEHLLEINEVNDIANNLSRETEEFTGVLSDVGIDFIAVNDSNFFAQHDLEFPSIVFYSNNANGDPALCQLKNNGVLDLSCANSSTDFDQPYPNIQFTFDELDNDPSLLDDIIEVVDPSLGLSE